MGKTFPYLPLRPDLAVIIWALIADEDQHLCDDHFVLYLSRIKSVPATGSKFSNLGGYNLGCCFGFRVLSPGLLSCWSHQ